MLHAAGKCAGAPPHSPWCLEERVCCQWEGDEWPRSQLAYRLRNDTKTCVCVPLSPCVCVFIHLAIGIWLACKSITLTHTHAKAHMLADKSMNESCCSSSCHKRSNCQLQFLHSPWPAIRFSHTHTSTHIEILAPALPSALCTQSEPSSSIQFKLNLRQSCPLKYRPHAAMTTVG